MRRVQNAKPHSKLISLDLLHFWAAQNGEVFE